MKIVKLDDIIEFMKQYEREEDKTIKSILTRFLSERCELSIDQTVSNNKLYIAYYDWDENQVILTQKTFNSFLRKLGVPPIRRKDGLYWIGLKLKDTIPSE